jgi:hypothetical protein
MAELFSSASSSEKGLHPSIGMYYWYKYVVIASLTDPLKVVKLILRFWLKIVQNGCCKSCQTLNFFKGHRESSPTNLAFSISEAILPVPFKPIIAPTIVGPSPQLLLDHGFSPELLSHRVSLKIALKF